MEHRRGATVVTGRRQAALAEASDPGPEAGVAQVLRVVRRLEGAACAGCGLPLCGHDAVVSLVLGLEQAPRCTRCVAGTLDQTPELLRGDLLRRIAGRKCHGAAWDWAQGRAPRGGEARCACGAIPGAGARD